MPQERAHRKKLRKASFKRRGSACDTRRETGIGTAWEPQVHIPPKGCRLERKRYAYRGILHPVSIIYGDSVEQVCVTPSSRDASCLVDVWVTPSPNVSVKYSEDERISDQEDIPIANNCVQTPDTLQYDQQCHSERKVAAVFQNNQADYSNKRVHSKQGPLLQRLQYMCYVIA